MTMTMASKGRLVTVPALITLGVTLLRLIGELQNWSPVFFSREPGGLGAIVGIIWLAPLSGVYFALKLLKQGDGPTTYQRAVGHAVLGFGLFIAFGLAMLFFWPPYQAQVIGGAVVALGIVLLQLRGWPELGQVMLLYAFTARLPVVIVMLFTILGSWGTHYDAFPSGFPLVNLWERWLWGGLVVQLTLWVGNTVFLGALCGSVAVAVRLWSQRSQRVV
ncbi:MAG TPA: hypothetical protein PLB18_21640 [Acidobacteriota bacterium]|nr:hypothetical protein [Acidobacteriota bacterium]